MKKKIVIGGYYGYGSLGDEAVLSVLINEIKNRYSDCEITVLSASPGKMKRQYGVKCVHRYDAAAIMRCFYGADLYISGGGSLIQDATSARSLRYYCHLMKMAKHMGAKVYAYANGIGPLKRSNVALSALSVCDMISVRDNISKQTLEELSVEAVLSSDPFFLIEPAPKNQVRRFLVERGIYEENYFTVSLRRCKGSRQINEDALLHALLPFVIKGHVPVFVSMQDSCDFALSAAMADITGGYVVTPTDASILLGLQKNADFAIGMRLHFLLAAIGAGIPVAALSYDPKVDNVLSYASDVKAFDAFDFDSDELWAYMENMTGYDARCDDMKQLAIRDIEAIGQLLEGEGQLVRA
ncbi:MAG: polysaccharide pyruvyl transferase CsaB [Clostridia bacterium]|nr:polysaccharide pyruvyl transferase CsaB [Clostridia bacterium]